ncbi:MAG: hypothetical protein AB1779_01125 [Candidatus Thermoplasmatota archaeon]
MKKQMVVITAISIILISVVLSSGCILRARNAEAKYQVDDITKFGKPSGSVEYNLTIECTKGKSAELRINNVTSKWNVTFSDKLQVDSLSKGISINKGKTKTIQIYIDIPQNAHNGDKDTAHIEINIIVYWEQFGSQMDGNTKKIFLTTTVDENRTTDEPIEAIKGIVYE